MSGSDEKPRARWNALIETEGRALGLADCRPFLENKTVNDVFYEGTFHGRACIVKCSSKAPDSIQNEFALSKRVFDADPAVTPEPLACRVTADGFGAFLVTAKASGPSLTERLADGLSETEADAFASDILRLADALRKAGVIHRDLFSDNLLFDSDGHLKAIDFQFAVDRNAYRECAWMKSNWKYRYVVFGVNHDLGLGVWNDAAALARVLEPFPKTRPTADATEKLRRLARDGSFRAPPTPTEKLKLFFYGFSLRGQILLHRGNKTKTRRLKTRLARLHAGKEQHRA